MAPSDFIYEERVQSIAPGCYGESVLLFPDGSCRAVGLCHGRNGWYCDGPGGFHRWWEAWGIGDRRFEFAARALNRTIKHVGEWPRVHSLDELTSLVKACNDHARTMLGDNPRPPREKPVPVELRCRKLRILS